MAENKLQCMVVTPEKAVLDQTADFVAIPMYDGELGVLPGRAPLIGRLGFGELRVNAGNAVERLFVDGGFLQIRENVVTVLTPRALPSTELKVETAQEALGAAKITATTSEEQEAQLKAQERARVQIRLAEKIAAELE